MRHSRRSQADFPLIDLSEFAQPPLTARRMHIPWLQPGWLENCENRVKVAAGEAAVLNATESRSEL
jgi:hypothetical protein